MSTTFARPNLLWFLLLDGGIATMVAFTASEPTYEAASAVVPLPKRSLIRTILFGTIVVHVGEALVARRMAKGAGLPTGRWTRQSFVVGFPSLLALKKLIASS